MKIIRTIGIAALLVAMLPHFAHAQTIGALDTIVQTFQGSVAAFGGSLTTAAEELFGALVVFEIVWVTGHGVMARADWTDIFLTIAKLLFVVGLFWFGLIHWPEFSTAIVTSFGQAANTASTAAGGSANLTPSAIFAAGMNTANHIWQGMSFGNPALSILLALGGVIIVIIFAWIVALMIEVLIESYFAAYAGIIMMGFGGTRYTRGFAEAQFRYAISIGVKRMVLQLLIGVSQTFMINLSNQVQAGNMADSWDTLGIMVGVPIVLLNLALKLPYRAQDLICGSSSYGGMGIVSTAAGVAAGAAAATTAAVGGITGAGAAAISGYRLTAAQMADSGGVGGSGGGGGGGAGGGGEAGGGAAAASAEPSAGGRISQAAMMVGGTARNVASATASDIGKRLTGNYAARTGHLGYRVAASMNAEREALQGKKTGG